ncbi:MAG: DEAD/DEAH box helicase [Synergistaceae bacterium]|nr:DEAD/DEAH box helicase [Synergistaceae bacterium]
MDKTSFYPWQIAAFRRLEGRSGVLSAPTGSGKTWVAYLWTGLIDTDGQGHQPRRPVIFTAPIKALSNERYMDLRRMGFDVGIETGDFKKNEGASIICCTQEIYTMKYAGRPGITLVIDEFHYIFDDPDRARSYIDGIRLTHPDSPVLVMSATFGGAEKVGRYLKRLTGRPFELYESQERATKLLYKPRTPLTASRIKDALVFVFSQRGAAELAELIAAERPLIDEEGRKRLDDLAAILQVDSLAPPLERGIGIYHGGMLPKEKLLVESAFRERILDVVVGTNALALGVNLPAETVVFGQLVRYHDRRPISKNEFLQMAGRAGRKGLFDRGFVTWFKNSPCESRGTDTGAAFRKLLKNPPEKAAVTLRPEYGKLLREEIAVDEEARYIARFSLPNSDVRLVEEELRSGLRKIAKAVRRLVPASQRQRFRLILADLWYGEMDIDENLEMAILFHLRERPQAMTAAEVLEPFERNYLQALLKVKRFANRLPQGYAFDGLAELNDAVEAIDPTIYGFEEKLDEIEGDSGEGLSFADEKGE